MLVSFTTHPRDHQLLCLSSFQCCPLPVDVVRLPAKVVGLPADFVCLPANVVRLPADVVPLSVYVVRVPSKCLSCRQCSPSTCQCCPSFCLSSACTNAAGLCNACLQKGLSRGVVRIPCSISTRVDRGTQQCLSWEDVCI